MIEKKKDLPLWNSLLRAVGIEFLHDRKWHAHLKPRFFLLIGLVALTIFAGMLGMAKFSEHPAFCNSCHIMEPYYNAWKTSQHHGKAVCVDCHYPPADNLGEHLWHKFQASAQVVKYITRTYSSKPFAEISDSACLRSGCHSNRLLEGPLVTQKGIKFDHRPHLTEVKRGRQLRCVSCHSQVVVGKHVEVTYDTCYLCHFKGRGEGKELEPIGGCLGCHDLPKQTFQVGNMSYNHREFVSARHIDCKDCHLDVVQGKGEAKQDRCFTCHNQPEKLARYGDIPFIHENHVTKHNVACFHCHEEIRHGFVEKGSSSLVSAASEGQPAEPQKLDHPLTLSFECSYCHEAKHMGQREMYTGQVASLGLPQIPSPMFLAQVDCIGCHYKEKLQGKEEEFTGKTFFASTTACIKCHGEKFRGIWEDTKVELSTTVKQLEEKVSAVRQAFDRAALEEKVKKDFQEKLAKADEWISFVKNSRGEHNVYLSSVALRKADELLTQIAPKVKAPISDLSSLPMISGGYCATLCHARVGVKVPPETVKVGAYRDTPLQGKVMPHQMHIGMLGGCVTCHEIGGHKKVPLKPEAEGLCMGCHPE
ncbi:MAG: NapC/NirT family cytochrome c [Deltaproteobacteria bacterium]|nr:NapC/NirT family cytochrome c [Deltaproteobacteria bacterium]